MPSTAAMSTTSVETPEPLQDERLEVVNRPRTGMWIATAVLLLFVASIVHAIATKSTIEWSVIGRYLFASQIIDGVFVTVLLTAVCMAVGVSLGLTAAVMVGSQSPILKTIGSLHVWFFRGVPVLVQIIFWFNLALILPSLSIGLPFVGVTFFEGDANILITPFVAAVLGLGVAESAYMSEIIRSGMLSVDHGQTEAGLSLGMTRARLLRRIVLPQAMRVIIPPTGNEFVGMLKLTSLVAVVSGSELLSQAQNVYTQSYQVVELLIVVSIWYLVLSTILAEAQRRIERRYGRGFARHSAPSTRSRLLLGGRSAPR